MFIFTIIESLNRSALGLLFAVMLIIGGVILGKLAEKFIYKFLKDVELNKIVRDVGLKINADRIISNAIEYLIYFLSVIAALEQLGIANTVITIISILVVLVVLISFYLAVRDFIPNFTAGMYLYSREDLKEGKYIELDSLKGELLGFDLLQIRIKTKSGDIIHIPNSTAVKNTIKVSSRKM